MCVKSYSKPKVGRFFETQCTITWHDSDSSYDHRSGGNAPAEGGKKFEELMLYVLCSLSRRRPPLRRLPTQRRPLSWVYFLTVHRTSPLVSDSYWNRNTEAEAADFTRSIRSNFGWNVPPLLPRHILENTLCSFPTKLMLIMMLLHKPTVTLKPRLHDTTGCQTGLTTGLTTVLNEQLFVSTGCQTALYNRFDNHVEQTATVRSTSCQTHFDNRVEQTNCSFVQHGCQTLLNEQPLFVQPVVVQPVWQPAVYTIQLFVKPVVKWVWQPVECLYTRYNQLSNQIDNRFDNGFHHRLYHVYTNIYPVVKPVWQQVVSCKRGFTVNWAQVKQTFDFNWRKESTMNKVLTCTSMRCLRSSNKLCSSSDNNTLPYNADTTAEATRCICSTPSAVSAASKHAATALGLSRSRYKKRPIFDSWYVRRRYPSVTVASSSTFTRWQHAAGVASSLANISWLRASFCWRAIHAEWKSRSAPSPTEACRACSCSRSDAMYRRSCFRWCDSSTKSATLVIDISYAPVTEPTLSTKKDNRQMYKCK